MQITGESYQIKDGELLVDIAQRVKPSGMTLRQTINALVAANPRAFRNGNPDLMYRGATLTIPDGDTLRRLAHNPPRRVSTRAQEERPAADTVPARQQPTVETQPTPPVTPPAPPAPPVDQAQPQPQQPAQPPVQQPPQEQPAVPPMVSDVAPETPASAALPDMGASLPEQASDMMVSEPVVETPPVEVAPPVVETPPMEEEGMDITQMALYGGGGLLALGGLAYLLMNRRRKTAAPARGDDHADDDDDGLYFESVTDHSDSLSATPAAPAAAAPVSQPAAPAAVQPATVSEQDLGLDLSHLDEQQQLGSTPSTEAAAQQAAADDWSWLEESEQPAAAPVAPTAPAAAEPAASDDDWLNFAAEEPAAPAQAPAQPASEPQAAPVAPEELDWVLEEAPVAQTFQAEAPAAVEVAEPAQPAVPEMDNTISFEAPSLETESVSSVAEEAAAPAAASNVMDFDLDFDSTPAAPAQAAPVEVSQPASAYTEPVSAGPLPKEALEAKLELAKMYLEIDDANTARQTLMELINESEGSSIQAEAQQLLNDIGQ